MWVCVHRVGASVSLVAGAGGTVFGLRAERLAPLFFGEGFATSRRLELI